MAKIAAKNALSGGKPIEWKIVRVHAVKLGRHFPYGGLEQNETGGSYRSKSNTSTIRSSLDNSSWPLSSRYKKRLTTTLVS